MRGLILKGALGLSALLVAWQLVGDRSVGVAIAALSLWALILHLGYGALQLHARHPHQGIDAGIDVLIFIILIIAIGALPHIWLTNLILTVFYVAIGARYLIIMARSERAKYAREKFRYEAPLALIFLSAGLLGWRGILGELWQALILFAVMVIGSAWLYFKSGVYQLKQ